MLYLAFELYYLSLISAFGSHRHGFVRNVLHVLLLVFLEVKLGVRLTIFCFLLEKDHGCWSEN